MESKQTALSFASVSGKKLVADFDGGMTTSDGGVLLLRELEPKVGIIDRIVESLWDRRHQSYVDHSYSDLIKQRVFQIACGYEDANDSNDLRLDPGMKAACDRLPATGDDLASQPTMCRLENDVSRTDLYRIGLAFVDAFIGSYKKPPKKIILDIDDTDDAIHGSQQLSLFNAHYNEYCFMPLHLYEGHTGKLITTILRPGRRIRGKVTAAILRRVFDRIRQAWPKVQILLRGDSHFSAPAVHDLCDEYEVDFILGQAVNKKLKTLGEPLMEEAIALSEKSEGPARLFSCFEYQAGTWACPRTSHGGGDCSFRKIRGTGSSVLLFRVSSRYVGLSTPGDLQSRNHQRKAQSTFCSHQHQEPNAQVSLRESLLCPWPDGRIYQEPQNVSSLGPDILQSLRGKPVPPLFAQCRLPAIARAQRHRSQRITMGEIQLRYNPTPHPKNRSRDSRTSDQDPISFPNIVSA